MATIYTGTLAPGASTTPQVLPLTALSKGLLVTQTLQMSAAVPYGVEVRYGVSIDGGTTYSDYVSLGHEAPANTITTESYTTILQNSPATHARFIAQNRDYSASATFTLTALIT